MKGKLSKGSISKGISKYLAAATLLLSPLAANAADMSVPAKAPMTPVAAVYDWTGFYLGINGGYGWGQQDPLTLLSNRFDRSSFATKLDFQFCTA